MPDLDKQERTALDAVAKQFSAHWQVGDAGVCLIVDGQPVALEIASIGERGANGNLAAKPRLRFDKVASRLIERLRDSLAGALPHGMAVAVTVTAPIRLASKTASALEENIRSLLARGSTRLDWPRDWEDTLHGNRVRVRFLRDESRLAPKTIGFVHNPDTDAVRLLNMTQEWLKLGGRSSTVRGERWLVLVAVDSSWLEPYRCVYSQLRLPTGFQKIAIAFADGSVGVLD